MKKILCSLVYVFVSTIGIHAQETSVAGFFPLEDAGRLIWSFNPEWRFHLGDVPQAEKVDFDDSAWEVVSTPHTIQLMPAEASGCRNYQGIAWYRKQFILPKNTGNKNVELHFEAIMGKQRIYVDGQLVKEHEGGYLPITTSTVPVVHGANVLNWYRRRVLPRPPTSFIIPLVSLSVVASGIPSITSEAITPIHTGEVSMTLSVRRRPPSGCLPVRTPTSQWSISPMR